MRDFRGQVAVVTGGSSGLGRRFSLELARAGATVVAVARRKELLDEVADECRRSSPRSEARPCDVSDVDTFRDLLGSVEAELARVDILINAAGIEARTTVEDQDIELYRRIMDTNFWAPVVGTLQVVPGMLRRGTGVVVNVSSDSARAPAAEIPAYAASKAALSAFTESIAHEVAGRGMHLHVLYPGWVPTAMGMGAVERGMPMPPRAVRRTEEGVSRLLMKKMGGRSIEINAARVAALAPLARAFFPRIYRRQIAARG